MPTYRGGCHCGAIRFEADGALTGLEVCNCSLCSKAAYVHWVVPPERFRLLTPEGAIATYQFGTRTSKNHFCRTCGIAPFRRARSDPDQVDVNVRCLDDVDVAALTTKPFNGRNWEAAMKNRGRGQDSR
jgi:hypothetical protein